MTVCVPHDEHKRVHSHLLRIGYPAMVSGFTPNI
ncbi:hypothetical protein Deipe_3509 [Deinococcus peraridilitoris DSM 19664]|uniref:Uncharacterized protein n=1 Tax=Deinococcus peraridilitoris (strain DSM 19664 / LMG 22246 / CIP 109416 / KR-200) TaxID=937777 RepID=L0A501_DEIPD|nr:hypothetical protein Deipe_3509 [Deinococcus peraridilitoris DSM 19664]